MGFLDDLLKGAQDTASRAYDQVNPFDGGKNWNQRTATPAPKQAPKRKLNYSPEVQQRLEQSAQRGRQMQADIYNPMHLLDAAGTVGKGIVDMGTGTITGIGNRVADFGQAGAEVIREFSGQNQADAATKQKQAAEYDRMSQSFLARAQKEQDPARRAAFINQARSLNTAKYDTLDQNAQDIQRGLNATDPRKTLTNAAETALDVATAGKGKLLLDGIKSTAAPVTKEALKLLAKNAAITSAQGAGLGAGYSGINTARDENATLQDYAKNMATGAAVGAGAGLVAQAGLPALAKGAEKTVQGTAKVAGAAKKQLDIAARKQDENFMRLAAQDKVLTRVEPHYIQDPIKNLDKGVISQKKAQILNGNIEPIIAMKNADNTLRIVDGAHNFAAYKELGVTQVPTKIITPSELKTMKQGGYAQVPGGNPERYQKQWKPHELMYMEQEARKAGDIDRANAYKQQREQLSSPQSPELAMANQHMEQMLSNIQSKSAPAEKPSQFANKTIQNSDEVSDPLKKLIKEEQITYKTTTNKERLAKADEYLAKTDDDTAFNEVLNKLESRHFDPQGEDAAVAIQLFKKLNANEDTKSLYQATELARAISEKGSNHGQEIQILSALSNRSPEGLRFQAEKELNKVIKGGVTPEISAKLQEFTQKIKKTAPDSAERNRTIAEMQKYVGSLVPDDLIDKVLTAWTAGLISGIKTVTGAPASNLTTALLGAVTNPTAAALDATRTALTGAARSNTVVSPTNYIKGFVKEGLPAAKNYLKTGIDERETFTQNSFTGGMRETNYKHKPIGTAVNGVFRVMSSLDRPFYYGKKAQSEAEIAKLGRLNAGKKNLPDLQGVAEKDARESVLDYDTLLSRVASAMKRAAGDSDTAAGRIAGKVATTVNSPFVRVPSAGLARMIDFSPMGAPIKALRQAAEMRWGNQKSFDWRDMNKAMAESAAGTGVAVLGFAMAMNNLVSGEYPDDPKEQARWAAEGITPNSVKMANPVTGKETWVSMNYLGPVGSLLQQGKRFYEGTKEGKNAIESALTAEAGVARDALNNSYLQGVNGLMEAAKDPEQNAMKYVNGLVSSTVPALVNDAANAIDDTQRTVNNAADAVMNRLPLLRQMLTPKQTVYGEELKQRTDPFNLTVNPLRPSNQMNSPVKDEVRRLHLADQNDTELQVTPTKLGKAISLGEENADGKNIQTKLTDKQRYDIQKTVGQATNKEWGKLIQTDAYKALDDKGKARALKDLRETVAEAEQHRYAMANNLGQYKSDFAGKKDKISKDAQKYMTAENYDITKFTKNKSNKSSGSTAEVSPNLAKNYKQTLDEFDALDSIDREKKIYKENDAEFRYEAAKYENKKASGTLTKAEAIKAEDKLAKLQVGSKFSKETRELYELNKSQLTTLIDKGEITEKQAADILAYGDALGTIGKTNKFKDKYGNVAIRPKAKGSGGRKGTGKGKGKGGAGSKKQLPSDDKTSTINLVASLSKKAANAKVTKRQIPSGQVGGIGKNIKAYKKVAKTNVSMTRKA